MTEKKFDIFVRNKRAFQNLEEEEFERTWKTLSGMADLFGKRDQLSYKEVIKETKKP